MPEDPKAVLLAANAAVARGDYDAFLAHCTDDTRWEFVGDRVLEGKDAVRAYMAEAYERPPAFDVKELIESGERLVAVGEITLTEKGEATRYAYCDVWTLRGGKLDTLRAFVVKLDGGA